MSLLWNNNSTKIRWRLFCCPHLLLLTRRWTFSTFHLWPRGNMFDICQKKLWRPINNVKSWQEKWGCQLLVGKVCVRDVQTSESCAFLKICHEFSFNFPSVHLLSFIAMWLHVLLVLRLRLPVSLLMLTEYTQRLGQRWSRDQKWGSPNNKQMQSGKQRFQGNWRAWVSCKS